MFLNRGRYLEGDLAKNLTISHKGIEFEAANLKLKSGALDELGLSVNLKRGYLKSLHIKISFSIYLEFFVDIEANGLYLLVYPQHTTEHFDFKAYKRQQLAIKSNKLEKYEERMLDTKLN